MQKKSFLLWIWANSVSMYKIEGPLFKLNPSPNSMWGPISWDWARPDPFWFPKPIVTHILCKPKTKSLLSCLPCEASVSFFHFARIRAEYLEPPLLVEERLLTLLPHTPLFNITWCQVSSLLTLENTSLKQGNGCRSRTHPWTSSRSRFKQRETQKLNPFQPFMITSWVIDAFPFILWNQIKLLPVCKHLHIILRNFFSLCFVPHNWVFYSNIYEEFSPSVCVSLSFPYLFGYC